MAGGLTDLMDPIHADYGAENNVSPEGRHLGGLLAIAAFSLAGVGAYFAAPFAIGASAEVVLVEGTVTGVAPGWVIGGEVYECTTLAQAEALATLDQTIAAGLPLTQGMSDALIAANMAAGEAVSASAFLPAAGIPEELSVLGMIGLTILPGDQTNIGNHGTYLAPYGRGGDSTPPGFPGFPGGGAPWTRSPFGRPYICIGDSQTPDGEPPVCYFGD